jgi:hypothetical protein
LVRACGAGCSNGKSGFECFLIDLGPRPKGTTIDRYPHKTGNYEPNNCRWATRKEQQNNTRRNVNIIINGRAQTRSHINGNKSSVGRRATCATAPVLSPMLSPAFLPARRRNARWSGLDLLDVLRLL